jgi:hypothetical protein
MLKWIKPLLIILFILFASFLTACQTAPPTAPSVSTTGTTTSINSNTNTGSTTVATQHNIAGVLGIQSVKITSPSRDTVTVSPLPSENITVPARIWETLDFECIAADQADHNLAYAWTCSSGKLKGEGSKVIWTAPGAGGDYTVTVNVTCDKGEKAALITYYNVKCCGD